MLSHFEYEIVKNCPEHRLPSVRLLSQCSYPWRKVAPIGTKLLQITHHRLIEQIWVQNPLIALFLQLLWPWLSSFFNSSIQRSHLYFRLFQIPPPRIQYDPDAAC